MLTTILGIALSTIGISFFLIGLVVVIGNPSKYVWAAPTATKTIRDDSDFELLEVIYD